ncbi:MAG: helix-turn-helix transcriptional regulator [Hyphomicrobiales bacterium]
MHEQLLSAIEQIYDCVGETFDVTRALGVYSEISDQSGIFLTDIGPDQKSFLSFDSHNIPEDSVKRASSLFNDPAENTILRLYPLLPRGVPTMGRAFYSFEEYQNTKMYQLASKPWGLHSECVCVLAREVSHGRAVGFVRHKGQSEIDPELLSILAILGRHLQKAMSFQKRIDKLESMIIQSTNVMDLIQFGLLLFDKDRNLSYANLAAQHILNNEDGIRLRGGELMIGHRKTEEKVHALLDSVFQIDASLEQLSGGIVTIPRLSHATPYSLIVVPMVASKVKLGKKSVAVFIFDPDARKTTAIDLFVASYGLTPSEAELAHALASGDKLETIASNRGVTRNTVKSQLHSIFSKTSTSRQSELVSLLLRSVAGFHL